MLNFLKIKTIFDRKTGLKIIEPSFITMKNSDLMVSGKEFYAIWDESTGLWSKDIFRAKELINKDLYEYRNRKYPGDQLVLVKDLDDYDNLTWVKFTNFISRHPDNYRLLDRNVLFADQSTTRESYASFKLNYSMANVETPCFDKLMNTCYSQVDQDKIMWFAGSIIDGASKRIQKFLVLYGDIGTGKGSVIDLLMKLFGMTDKDHLGYTATFDADSLGDSRQQFATSAFKNNPIVAFQPDGKLDRLDTNTVINKITAHEFVPVNEKQVRIKPMCLDTMLIMGTNNPVKITDAKSGLLRRIVDVSPIGRTLEYYEYQRVKKGMAFELGGIAYKCLTRFRELGEDYYQDYRPVTMQLATDPTYNFLAERYDYFASRDGVTLGEVYPMYKLYMEDCGLTPMNKMKFREELKTYYDHFNERISVDGVRQSSYFSGFRKRRFGFESGGAKIVQNEVDHLPDNKDDDQPITFGWIELKPQKSMLDQHLSSCPAQYAKPDGTPLVPWDSVETTLKDIDTAEVHYVLPPVTHVEIDIDKKVNGKKDISECLKYAVDFPETYC